MNRWCVACGTSYIELHHIVFKSENKALEDCKLNHIYLCPDHHRGTYGPHGAKGSRYNKKLKLEFQRKLENLWDKALLTKEDINKVLEIPETALTKLLKIVKSVNGKYEKEDVIRACLGGKLYG